MPKTRRSTRQQAKENKAAVDTSDDVENINAIEEKSEKTAKSSTTSANKLR